MVQHIRQLTDTVVRRMRSPASSGDKASTSMSKTRKALGVQDITFLPIKTAVFECSHFQVHVVQLRHQL